MNLRWVRPFRKFHNVDNESIEMLCGSRTHAPRKSRPSRQFYRVLRTLLAFLTIPFSPNTFDIVKDALLSINIIIHASFRLSRYLKNPQSYNSQNDLLISSGIKKYHVFSFNICRCVSIDRIKHYRAFCILARFFYELYVLPSHLIIKFHCWSSTALRHEDYRNFRRDDHVARIIISY